MVYILTLQSCTFYSLFRFAVSRFPVTVQLVCVVVDLTSHRLLHFSVSVRPLFILGVLIFILKKICPSTVLKSSCAEHSCLGKYIADA